MLSDKELMELIEKVVKETGNMSESKVAEVAAKVSEKVGSDIEDGELKDIGKINIKDQLLVDNPEDRDEYMKLKQRTSARLGIGRAG